MYRWAMPVLGKHRSQVVTGWELVGSVSGRVTVHDWM